MMAEMNLTCAFGPSAPPYNLLSCDHLRLLTPNPSPHGSMLAMIGEYITGANMRFPRYQSVKFYQYSSFIHFYFHIVHRTRLGT